MKEKLPVFFIPHGGGPWHVINDSFGDPEGYEELRKFLKTLGEKYSKKIKAVLVISGHWEEKVPTINFSENPNLLYDYYGFPEYTYHLTWPAHGDIKLAEKIEQLLTQNGFKTAREYNRGYDHGVFVPLTIAFPNPEIPVVQLSLIQGLDPQQHINMGKALEPLREEDVLIIGSGMSYHNIQSFFSNNPKVKEISEEFDNWLNGTITNHNNQERETRLIDWHKAPGASFSHPRSEHLLPLFICAGAGNSDQAKQVYSDYLMGAKISAFAFGI
jgi:aromatic ring-opening dioxygenase catalytic subunit (LigB family)